MKGSCSRIAFIAATEAGTASAVFACDLQTSSGPGASCGRGLLRKHTAHAVDASNRRAAGPQVLAALLSGLWVACATLALPAAADASFLHRRSRTKSRPASQFRPVRRARHADRAVLDGPRPTGEDCPQATSPAVRGHPDPVPAVALFGGLLWPIAWIWAYSKPVMYKMAYGTDKAPHEVDAEGSAGTSGSTQEPSHAPAPTLGLHSALAPDRRPRPARAAGPPRKARPAAGGADRSRAELDALEAKLASKGR